MLPWHETCNSSCYLFKFNDQTRPAFSNESASCYICLLHQFLGFNFFKILYNNSCQNSIFADLSNNIVYLTLTSLLVHHQHRYPSIFPVHLHHAQLLFCSITLLSSPNSLFFIYLFYHPYHRPSIYKNLSHWQSVSTVWVWHIHTHTHTLYLIPFTSHHVNTLTRRVRRTIIIIIITVRRTRIHNLSQTVQTVNVITSVWPHGSSDSPSWSDHPSGDQTVVSVTLMTLMTRPSC